MTHPDASIIQYQNRPSIRHFVLLMFSQKPKYAASGQLGRLGCVLGRGWRAVKSQVAIMFEDRFPMA